MSKLANVQLQARALWARVCSYFKKDWTVDDYLLLVRFNPPERRRTPARRKALPWFISIVNWPGPCGGGDTKAEALADLSRNFDQFKLKNKLPRPGSKVPVQFASTTRVDIHSCLAKDFIKRVLEIDWAWISDDSALSDFHSGETDHALLERIRAVYGVDVSDISAGNLADVFDRISAHSKPIQRKRPRTHVAKPELTHRKQYC